ncbi:hypothetical protein ACQVQ3_05020 [Bacillus cereus]|uniref:hypothetical protein n=1 Tax=Bacillus TaxID=1386 RepID=UPI00201630F3|nr:MULTISPECIES: hypothetical protein [Bacillus]MCP1177963.1 hypothetical protein [Bacillus sp. 1663tsa1]MCP1283129.1 hypothetical protein [Bacillus sp. S0635]MCQ6349635.1 hypothetical protein [Bacillus cereus]MCU5751851.1 hypothetical protein [Bacillus cereus]MDA1633341.1 hypothetical protein [Bacillus cereus]
MKMQKNWWLGFLGFIGIYPALTGSKTPTSQNSAEAKKLGGDQLPVKARLVQLIISGG